MAAPKAKTPQQSEAIDREINDLDIRGYTPAEIATNLGISRPAVVTRLKKLNARTVTDRAERVAQELRTLERVIHEALNAWEKSKAATETVTFEQWGDGKERTIKKTEQQTGNPAHLANALKAAESRRKLLGLDALAKEVNLSLTPAQLAALSDEEIEALYAKLVG